MHYLLTNALPPFSEFNVFWSVIVQFGILMAVLLLANVLRRRIPLLKKSLLPVAVIGGFVWFCMVAFAVGCNHARQ